MEGLILAYTALIANANVRMLLKSVVQDAQLETINFSESKQPILNVYALIRDENEKTIARTAIIGFLNQVMYMIYPNYIQKANTLDSINIWLWENHTRLSKFLTVSMVLESANLKSFGVDEPDWSDIPQALIKIPIVIRFAKATTFPELQKKHLKEIRSLEENNVDYLNLYTNKRTKTK